MAKGFWGARSKLYAIARQSVAEAMVYSYRDRRTRKREFRRLWVCRINAAARMNGLTYATFMKGLREAGVTLNRKVLAELAVSDPRAFTELATTAKGQGS
jgi:large subunit ribosomal protein L20